MTWKERRNVTILLCIAGGLFLALLVVFGMIYRQDRAEVLAGRGGPQPEDGSYTLTDPSVCTGLSYYNGAATLSFALDEDGAWTWADSPDFPLNDGTVKEIVETLSNLKFQQVLTATESKESYGLDNPSATLTATTGDGSAQSLTFGKTTTDGDSYYMMMNGDESTVYIVADTLVKQMQLPIYDMCTLPELPDLSELNLRAITILGPVPAAEPPEGEEGAEEEEPADQPEPERPAVVLNARRSNGDDKPALWFEGADNVTANALLQDLLYDLRTMSMAKCVDYRPSEEAEEICGFDSPDAILKVEYTSNGANATFTMRVGARMPDESGRYVQLEDDTTIYALPSGSADALMTISVAGMRGAAQGDAQDTASPEGGDQTAE